MTLENLVKAKLLHQEAPDKSEITGLLKSANERLKDSENAQLAFSSRFDLAYNAAHGFALAGLRVNGFRTDKRYLVFQCLPYTAGLEKTDIRIFSLCHEKRNLAEYEGYFDVDESLLIALIKATKRLGQSFGDSEL